MGLKHVLIFAVVFSATAIPYHGDEGEEDGYSFRSDSPLSTHGDVDNEKNIFETDEINTDNIKMNKVPGSSSASGTPESDPNTDSALPILKNMADPLKQATNDLNSGIDITAPNVGFDTPAPAAPPTFIKPIPAPPPKTVNLKASIDGVLDKLDDQLATVKSYWDKLLGQSNIQEETKEGLAKTEQTLSDAELTKKEVLVVGTKADDSVAVDEANFQSSKSTVEMAKKVVEDDMSIQEIAAEAKRWMEKVIERSNTAAADSSAALKQAEDSMKMASSTLEHDSALRDEVKALYVQSNNAIQEATDARQMLQQLQQREVEAVSEAEKAKQTLSEVRNEENYLREEENKLRKRLIEEEAAKSHLEMELKQLKQTMGGKVDGLSHKLTEDEEEKETLKKKLAEATQQLAAQENAFKELEAKNNATALELEKEKEEVAKEKEELSKEKEVREKTEQDSQHKIQEALDAAKKAQEHADEVEKKELESEDKAHSLEQEFDLVRQRMEEKLNLARERTKEWLRTQTETLVTEEQKQAAEIARLQSEIARLEKEKREEMDEILKAKQAEIAARAAVTPAIAPQPVATAPSSVVLQSPPAAVQNALELDESAMPAQSTKSPKAAPTVDMKTALYDKLMKAHNRVENLLRATGALTPSIPSEMMDLERASDSDYKLARRAAKQLERTEQAALPSGYPPPPGTARAQEVTNLELEEGVGAVEASSALTPNTGAFAQGVDDPSAALSLSPAHRDNCIRICSGGDRTVYRDGVVSTIEGEGSSTHETGACMKMCAMFSMDAH